MPPRYAYWTIIVDDQPTAFRSGSQEELLPTFKRLKAKNDTAVMMWFQNGKLWPSRVDAQEAMLARGEMGRRGDERQLGRRSFSEGGSGSGFRDRERRPTRERSAWTPRGEPSTPPPARNADDKLDWKPKGEFVPAPKRSERPERSEWAPKRSFDRESKPDWKSRTSSEKPAWKPKGSFDRESKPDWKSRTSSEKPAWKPKGSFDRESKPDWKSKHSSTRAPEHRSTRAPEERPRSFKRPDYKPSGDDTRSAKPQWKPKGSFDREERPRSFKPRGDDSRSAKPEWKPKGSFDREAKSDWKPKGRTGGFSDSRSAKPEWKPKGSFDREARSDWKPKHPSTRAPEHPSTSDAPPTKRKWVPKEEYKKSMGIEVKRDDKWRPGGEHKDPKQKYKDAKKAKWTKFKQNIRARSTGGKGKKSS